MDNFGLREAHVACHQLGYARALIYGLAKGLHSPRNGDINIDNLTCTGAETILEDCKFNGWGSTTVVIQIIQVSSVIHALYAKKRIA